MNTHEQGHRGANLNDKTLFSGEQLLRLHDAVYESGQRFFAHHFSASSVFYLSIVDGDTHFRVGTKSMCLPLAI